MMIVAIVLSFCCLLASVFFEQKAIASVPKQYRQEFKHVIKRPNHIYQTSLIVLFVILGTFVYFSALPSDFIMTLLALVALFFAVLNVFLRQSRKAKFECSSATQRFCKAWYISELLAFFFLFGNLILYKSL